MNCRVCLKKLSANESSLSAHRRCLLDFFGTSSLSLQLTFSRNDLTGELLAKNTHRMSISGVQEKLSMRLQDGVLLPTDTGGEYILKPSPAEYSYASENEHLSMLLGQLFKIETSPCALISFRDGENVYLTKRYDRTASERIHQEDMAQVLGQARESTGEYKYEGSYEEVGKTIRGACGGKLAPVLDLFRRILVRFIIKDGDYHLKNISIWKPNETGVYQGLSPNYDMFNTGIYSDSDYVFALNLLANNEFTPNYESLGYYTWSDFAELAKRIELTQRAAERVRNDITKLIPKAQELIRESFLPETMKIKYLNDMDNRLKDLLT